MAVLPLVKEGESLHSVKDYKRLAHVIFITDGSYWNSTARDWAEIRQ